MKICRVLWVLVIPLIFSGCTLIKVITNVNMGEGGAGGPGRLPTCGLSGTSPNDCQCSAGCNCPAGHYCAPGTP